MKKKIFKLLNCQYFQMAAGGIIIYLSFIGVILTTIQIPPDAILDSGLREIILVFEG